jgi:translocation and assembly module TamB
MSRRRRKWIGAAVILLALALVSLYAFLQTEWLQDAIRDGIVDGLESKFDVRVGLEEVSLSLFSGKLNLEGFRIENRSYPADRPAISLEKISLRYSFLGFLKPWVSVDLVELEGLELRIIENPNNRLNLANMFSPNQRGGERSMSGFLKLAIEELKVDRGLVVYEDKPIRLESAKGGLQIDMTFEEEIESYRGKVTLSDFDWQIGGFGLEKLNTEIEFEVHQKDILFPSVRFDSKQLRGNVVGTLSDINDLSYRFETDVHFTPAEINRPDLDKAVAFGEIRTVGIFQGAKSDFNFTGTISSGALGMEGQFELVSMIGQVEVDRDGVSVDRLSADFEGGQLALSGTMFWDENKKSSFLVDGDFVDLNRFSQRLDYDALDFTGRTDFQGTAEWMGSKVSGVETQLSASLLGDLHFVNEEGGRLSYPFKGASVVQLNLDRIGFSDGMLDVAGGQLGFQGEAEFGEGFGFDYTLQSALDEEFIRLLSWLNGEASWFWESLQFRTLLASGAFGGGSGDLVLSGDLRIDSLGDDYEKWGGLRTLFRWDGDFLELKETEIHGQAQRLYGGLTLNLQEERPGVLQDLDLTAENVLLDQVVEIFSEDAQIEGLLSGDFRLSRPESAELEGQGSFTVTSLQSSGEEIERVAGRLRLQEGRWEVRGLRADFIGGTFAGGGWMDPAEQTVSLEIVGDSLALGLLNAFPDSFELQGEAGLSFEMSGEFSDPQFNLQMTADQVSLHEYPLDEVRLTVRNSEKDKKTADLALESKFRDQGFVFLGNAGLAEPHLLSGSIQFSNLPVAPYLPLISDADWSGVEGQLSGGLTVEGPLDEPGSIEVEAAFPALAVSLGDYEVRNENPLVVTMKQGKLLLEPVTLTGGQTQLDVSGSWDTGSDQLHSDLKGKVNLAVFSPLVEGGTLTGELDIEAVVTGSMASPRIVGSADLRNGFLRHPSVPTTFSDGEGRLRFTANQVAIEHFSARTQLGEVAAEGGIFLEGFEPQRWLINFYGSGLRLQYPRDMYSVLDVDVDFIKNEKSQMISGAVYVRSSEYRADISIAELVTRSSSGPSGGQGYSGPEVLLDIAVEGYNSFTVDNNLAELVATGDFRLRGTLENPIVLGSINVDSGKLFLEGNEYILDRGAITFSDPRRTRPVFNFEAQTDVRHYNVTALLHGPLDQLNLSLRSDPPLPSASILTLLAVGRTQGEILGVREGTTDDSTVAGGGASALLARGLTSQLQEQSNRLFGLERLSVDPFLTGAERNPAAQVTLGKQLNKNITLTYSTVLGTNEQGQVLVVEVKLTDWVTLVGSGDQTGSIAVDFKFRKRF